MKRYFRNRTASFRIAVALLLLLLLLGVGSLVFVSPCWSVFDMPENQQGVGPSTGNHSSEAQMAVTHYNIISEKLSARAHGESWIKSTLGQRRSLLRKRTPPGTRPPPPNPRRKKTPSPPPGS